MFNNTDAGQPNNEQTVKIELLSQWKLEAEFRKNVFKLGPLIIMSDKSKMDTVARN